MIDNDVLRVVLDTESSILSPDQMAGYLVTGICVIINVVVAYLILKRFVFKRLANMIGKRQESLNNELDEAVHKNEEATGNLEDSKKQIEEARIKASGIIEEARENAQKQADGIVKKAREDAAEILARAEEDAARMKRNAFESMKDDIADLSVQIAGHIIGDAVSKDELQKSAAKHTEEILSQEVAKSE